MRVFAFTVACLAFGGQSQRVSRGIEKQQAAVAEQSESHALAASQALAALLVDIDPAVAWQLGGMNPMVSAQRSANVQMGRGDKRTKKGKRHAHSFGKARLRKTRQKKDRKIWNIPGHTPGELPEEVTMMERIENGKRLSFKLLAATSEDAFKHASFPLGIGYDPALLIEKGMEAMIADSDDVENFKSASAEASDDDDDYDDDDYDDDAEYEEADAEGDD